jgi:predicted DNA-binding protein YlxM (UPF0122 family)
MPRSKDPVLQDRDRKMLNEFLAGDITVQELAEREGLSRQRIYQIFSRFARSDVPEELSVDEHVIMLQNVRGKLYREFMKGPQYKHDVRGQVLTGVDGEYEFDLQEWGNFSQTFLKVDESLRHLKARDLPRRKQLGLDEAQIEILAHIAKLEKTTVHAEVLPPEEPSPASE